MSTFKVTSHVRSLNLSGSDESLKKSSSFFCCLFNYL